MGISGLGDPKFGIVFSVLKNAFRMVLLQAQTGMYVRQEYLPKIQTSSRNTCLLVSEVHPLWSFEYFVPSHQSLNPKPKALKP